MRLLQGGVPGGMRLWERSRGAYEMAGALCAAQVAPNPDSVQVHAGAGPPLAGRQTAPPHVSNKKFGIRSASSSAVAAHVKGVRYGERLGLLQRHVVDVDGRKQGIVAGPNRRCRRGRLAHSDYGHSLARYPVAVGN